MRKLKAPKVKALTLPDQPPKTVPNHTIESFQERLAKCFGWPIEQVRQFSLITLRGWARQDDPILADELTEFIRKGLHLKQDQAAE